MDLSFKEKSAWGLLLSIAAVSVYYFPRAVDAAGAGQLIGISIVGVVALVAFQVFYHAVVAGFSPGDVEEDERDSLIDLKAERIAGFALGIVLFTIIGRIVLSTTTSNIAEPSALLIAVWILAAITVSEIIKLIAVIGYYRIGS